MTGPRDYSRLARRVALWAVAVLAASAISFLAFTARAQDQQLQRLDDIQAAMCRGFDGVSRRQLPPDAAQNERDIVQAGRDVVALVGGCDPPPP